MFQALASERWRSLRAVVWGWPGGAGFRESGPRMGPPGTGMLLPALVRKPCVQPGRGVSSCGSRLRAPRVCKHLESKRIFLVQEAGDESMKTGQGLTAPSVLRETPSCRICHCHRRRRGALCTLRTELGKWTCAGAPIPAPERCSGGRGGGSASPPIPRPRRLPPLGRREGHSRGSRRQRVRNVAFAAVVRFPESQDAAGQV